MTIPHFCVNFRTYLNKPVPHLCVYYIGLAVSVLCCAKAIASIVSYLGPETSIMLAGGLYCLAVAYSEWRQQ